VKVAILAFVFPVGTEIVVDVIPGTKVESSAPEIGVLEYVPPAVSNCRIKPPDTPA
jgi:hypothetical protein